MGGQLYPRVFAPAVREARARGETYESMRDRLRRRWKCQDDKRQRQRLTASTPPSTLNPGRLSPGAVFAGVPAPVLARLERVLLSIEDESLANAARPTKAEMPQFWLWLRGAVH
jgi:hypothetical protein